MKCLLFILITTFYNLCNAQNIGIGLSNPAEKLEVNGKLKTDGVTINTGGSPFDFLSKTNAAGLIGFRKGHGAMGMHYIICTSGLYPNSSGPPLTSGPFVGQVTVFAGDFAPAGWMFCHGQEIFIRNNTALYSILGIAYGGTDSTFLLPDLRGRAPVEPGTSTAGYSWTRGQNSY